MPDIPNLRLVGRLGLTVGDGSDPDTDPDVVWCSAGIVRFTPVNTYTKVAGGTPVPFSAGNAAIDVPIDSSGFLSWGGARNVPMLDLTSSAVNPAVAAGKATHTVQFRNVTADPGDGSKVPVAFPSSTIRIASDNTVALTDAQASAYGLASGAVAVDITKALPVPAAGGTPITVGQDGAGITALMVDGSTLKATLSNGDELSTDLPAPMVDSDAFVASQIEGDGTATKAALNAATAAIVEAKAPLRFAFLADGNSITNYWTTTEGFAAHVADRIGALGGDLVVIEAGVGGDRTSDILGRLPALYAANSASVALCLASVNDRKQNVGLTPAQTMENLRRMVAIARLNGATPLLQTDPPLNPVRATVADANFVWASEYDARAVNDMVRAYATSQGLPLADVAAAFAYNDVSASTADGIHPIGTTTSGIGGLDIVMVTLADAIGGKPVQVYGTPNILPTLAGTWDPDEASLTTTWDRVAEDTGQTDHVAVATCTGTAGSAYDASAITRDDGTGNHYLALCEVAADRSAAVKFYKVAAGPTPTELTEFAIPAGTLGDQTEITLASIGTAHTVRINGITTIEATDATYTTGTSIGVEKVGNPLNVTSLSAYTA